MVVEIKPDVFENEDFYIDLRYLIQLCTRNYRYDFHIEFDKISHSNTFKNLAKDQQEVIKEFYNRSITQSWHFTHTVSEDNDQYYSINEAITFLEKGFFIFLENSENDGYFMDCLRKHFKKHCKKLNHHKKNLWIEYSMGAGSTIDKAIETKLKMFEQFSKPNHKYLRCFVLLDSDKGYPSQPYKTELNKLIEFLKENEIPHHVLEKREMENYLPGVVYDEIEDNDAFVQAFRKLSPEQKDFFDLEKGLPNKNFEQLSDEIKLLYNDLSTEDKNTFKKRNLKLAGSFKNEFPKLFESDLITTGNLLERCIHQNNPNELPDLLTQINELL